MGFRFRKSFGKGPFRVNISKSGIGYSVGTKGLRYTKKAGGGTRTTASIPGTGISFAKDSSKRRHSQTKSTRISKASATPTSSPNSSTSNSIGCLIPSLCVVGGLAFLGIMRDYLGTVILVALICGAAYLLSRYIQNKEGLPDSDATSKAKISENEMSPTIVQETTQEDTPTPAQVFQARKEAAIARFDAELHALPLTSVEPSTPADRQLLKNLPPYSFSNITRNTRLDSIFPLVFLDVETTGLYPSKSEIIEVSAIKFDTGMIPISAFTTLCKPKKPIPDTITAINHITDDMVAEAPPFYAVAPALTAFLNGCNVAGHNLDFDLRFIFAHGVHLPTGKRFYDTLDLAHLTISDSNTYDYKLDTLCGRYGIWRGTSHRSLADCYATSKLFAHLVFDKTSRQLVADPEGSTPETSS